MRKKKWDLNELPKFEKNFYNEHPDVQRMSQVFPHTSVLQSWRTTGVCAFLTAQSSRPTMTSDSTNQGFDV